jgi:hypothetical protein
MSHRTSRFLIPVLILSWLAFAGPATASSKEKAASPNSEKAASPQVEYKKVKDEAGFFQPETLDKVNALVKEIKEKYGKDFYVETFPAPPADRNENPAGMTQSARERFFQKWAEERAKIADVDGIYVLVCKEPPHAAVVVSRDLANRFTEADVAHLKSLLPGRGIMQRNDNKFVEAASYVRQVLAAPPRETSGASTPWILVWFTLGLLGVVAVLVLLRAVTSRHHHHADGHPAPDKATAGRHSGIVSGIGGPIGTAPGHGIPRIHFRQDDEPAPRNPPPPEAAEGGLADTQQFSPSEEGSQGEQGSGR